MPLTGARAALQAPQALLSVLLLLSPSCFVVFFSLQFSSVKLQVTLSWRFCNPSERKHTRVRCTLAAPAFRKSALSDKNSSPTLHCFIPRGRHELFFFFFNVSFVYLHARTRACATRVCGGNIPACLHGSNIWCWWLPAPLAPQLGEGS